ncbi:MAG: ATP synthase F1 subunit epsilon [Phototrophicales bacterium]|nr:ATP synthase F1 subunit epsilon [Phototrophicales bacterium]
MDKIHIELVSQEKKVFEELNATMVLIPAVEGTMGVLPNHAPTIAALGFGELIVRKGTAEERFAVFGGVVDVRPGKVVVLAELAASSYAIDIESAEKARTNAEKLLREGLPPEANRAAALALRKASLELQIGRNLRQRGPIMRILEEDEKAE